MRATTYWQKVILQLRSKWVKSVQNNLNFFLLKVVFQSPWKLHTLFRFKDSLNKKIHSDVAHFYLCSSCNATYYGKTYRHFFLRAAEHVGISNLTGKRVKNMKELSLSDHRCDCTVEYLTTSFPTHSLYYIIRIIYLTIEPYDWKLHYF